MTRAHLQTMIEHEIATINLRLEKMQRRKEDKIPQLEIELRNDLARLHHQYSQVAGRDYNES